MLGVACHHRLWQHTRSNDVWHHISSPPLDSAHGKTASGIAYHHRLWAAHTVERRRMWHYIISLGRQTRSDDVRRDMPSPPLDSTHGRTTSGVTCHHHLLTTHTVERRWAWHDVNAFGQHTQSNDVRRDMPTQPLDSPHGRTTSSVAFHYRFWAAHTVERRLAWRDIVTFRQHKRSNDVGRGMTSPP